MAAPYSTPIPGATGLGMYEAQAKAAYQAALARVSGGRNELLRNAGFEGEYGADGGFTGMKVSATNRFGGYQQMLAGHAGEDEAMADVARSRGLSGGLANQFLSRGRDVHAGQTADFAGRMTSGLGDLAQQQQGAADEYFSGGWRQALAAAQSAISDGEFNPADFSGLDPADYAALVSGHASGGGTPHPTGQPKSGKGVRWGPKGQVFTTQAQMTRFLRAHGKSYKNWAKNHKAAAKRLKGGG